MYFNRELNWLEFNERVLMECNDKNWPLLERLKFSAIFASNLDEFFMVRVAAIMNQIRVGYDHVDPSGYTAKNVLDAIHKKVRALVATQYQLTNPLLDQLDQEGVHIIRKASYDSDLLKVIEQEFNAFIFPVLTPMAVDFTRRFPLVANKHLHVAVKLRVEGVFKLAIVQVPGVLSRLIKVGKSAEDVSYVLLEEVIECFVQRLFIGHEIIDTGIFRVTRNGDLKIVEDEAEDLLMVIEEAVKLRKWGETVRLEVNVGMDPWLSNALRMSLALDERHVYSIEGILDLTLLMHLKMPKALAHLSKKAYVPANVSKKSLFKNIRQGDVFVHHPFDGFDVVLDFVKEASKDPNVLAIKQTLYRVSGDSPIVKALGEAAERGKQVTVLVELLARFDEENNIQWAKKLEQRGVHVIYGILGLKTHSKITLVVRKEKNQIRRYLHLGTGNYNDQTAKVYTDMGIFTCKETFASDASLFFNMVSGFATRIQTQVMSVAPFGLRERFEALIDKEIKQAKKGKPAWIKAKMNALVDVQMIDKLYEASQAGVKIDLIVRGTCTLKPGVDGLSENIRVMSIVGEFLEHSRIYAFANGGVFLSSADWMTRNLSRRIELLFPVEDPNLCEQVLKILDLYLSDPIKAWHLGADGHYYKLKPSGESKQSAQEALKKWAHKR